MKQIIKEGAPWDYKEWCRKMKGKPNEDYRRLQNPEKSLLHEQLLDEQGYICAYTMKRVSKDTSHIEHIKPETLCRVELRGSDLDYGNLVACFPKEGMPAKIRYGAQKKDHWWENEGRDFISPISNNCEVFFDFNLKGEIKANNNTNAQTTINVLKLDHTVLTEDRKRSIEEFIYGGGTPLSLKQATQSIDSICEKTKKGKFRQYCIAIQHALQEYKILLEKRANKRKYQQKVQRKQKK